MLVRLDARIAAGVAPQAGDWRRSGGRALAPGAALGCLLRSTDDLRGRVGARQGMGTAMLG